MTPLDTQQVILDWAWMVIITGPIKVRPMPIMMVWALTMVPLRLSVQPPMTAVVFGVQRSIPMPNLVEPCLHPLIHTNQAI